MKQVLQDLQKGRTYVAEVPAPQPAGGEVLLRTRCTLISPGTERMLVDFGKSSLLGKMRSQPERVRQVLEKMRTDGVLATVDAVRSKLGDPLPLGYCNVGIATGAGDDATAAAFPPGIRVASNGHHAGVVAVGRNLCARVPDGVSDQAAAFTVLGAIALQGVRLAAPTLGETVLVMGCGMVGLMAVQLLRANGCHVLASDPNAQRRVLAEGFGAVALNPAAVDVADAAASVTSGRGADAVLIAAAAGNPAIIRDAANAARVRGRLVLLGVVPLNLDREPFFRKELSFQVSCSYGPGRYDEAYEHGADYPAGFVRWTAQRNFEAVLGLMADGRLDPTPLLTHRFAIEEAQEAYRAVLEDPEAMGILLEFDREAGEEAAPPPSSGSQSRALAPAKARGVSVIGAGNYARRFLLPALQQSKRPLRVIVSAKGVHAATARDRFGFAQAASAAEAALADPETGALVVATRHDTHAGLAARALLAGKDVFVEKPLALGLEELGAVRGAAVASGRMLVTGFNRRLAPAVGQLRDFFADRQTPLSMDFLVNAGRLPAGAWPGAPGQGGRLIGEGCHFLDLMQHLAGCPWKTISATGPSDEQCSVLMGFEDGSIGALHYWANGPKSHGKELLRVFGGGNGAVLDNFRSLELHRGSKAKQHKFLRQDKGQKALVAGFLKASGGGAPPPMTLDEQVDVTLATFAAVEALRTQTVQRREDWLGRLDGASSP